MIHSNKIRSTVLSVALAATLVLAVLAPPARGAALSCRPRSNRLGQHRRFRDLWNATGSMWWNGASDGPWVSGSDAAFGVRGGRVVLGSPITAHNLSFNSSG